MNFFLKIFSFVDLFSCPRLRQAASLAEACRIFSFHMFPDQGSNPRPLALGAQNLSPWSTRDVPLPAFLTITSSKSCPHNLYLPRWNSHNLTSRPSPCLTSPPLRLGFSFQSLSPYDMPFGPCPDQSPRELLMAHPMWWKYTGSTFHVPLSRGESWDLTLNLHPRGC